VPFNQLASPCWVLDPEGGPGGDGEDCQHWPAEAEALKYMKKTYPPEDYPPGSVAVVIRPGPCWIITCDGECGEEPEDDEYAHIHCATRTEAEQVADAYDWKVTKDGRAFCEDDAPAGRSLDELAVVEQIPGQLTLLGEEETDA
jgi:hypothetical protein